MIVMSNSIEISKCPCCHTTARRSTLRAGNGYLYDCPACGGLFEIGTGAQSRADRGDMHPDVVTGVRKMIAEGKRPRVELDAPNNCFTVKALSQPSSTD